MLDIDDFKNFVVIPALKGIGLYSFSAQQLLLGTALVESQLTYLAQRPQPIALSIFQIEEPTFFDLRARLYGRGALMQKVLDTLHMETLPVKYNFLAGNLTAATIFARLKYFFDPTPLPSLPTGVALSEIWGKIYNTKNLEQDKKRFVDLYNRYLCTYRSEE